MNYPVSDRVRNTGNKSINQKDEKESKSSTKTDKDGNHESSKTRLEEDDTKLSDEFVTLMMVTRGTSPTAPASSSYVRNRRAEVGIIQQKEVTRPRKPPETMDKEMQCDRIEETSRFSRYGGSNRVSGVPWSTYLDKYSSGISTGGGSSMYSSRGFTNASSGRLNFAYARTNDVSCTRNESTTKETLNSNQETHNPGNRSQNEKVFDGNLNSTRSGNENSSASNNLKTSSSSGQDTHVMNKDATGTKVEDGEQCSCGARKTGTSGSLDNSESSNRDLAFHRGEDSTTPDSRERNENSDRNNRQRPASKSNEYNQRRPSIPRLGSNSPKGEMKIVKSSSKPELTSQKPEAYERRGSTPKSDVSSSSRTDESLRIVEGHCQDQNEDVISHKRDALQRKDSTSRYISIFNY